AVVAGGARGARPAFVGAGPDRGEAEGGARACPGAAHDGGARAWGGGGRRAPGGGGRRGRGAGGRGGARCAGWREAGGEGGQGSRSAGRFSTGSRCPARWGSSIGRTSGGPGSCPGFATRW